MLGSRMSQVKAGIVLHKNDNVVVALENIQKGETIMVGDDRIEVSQNIPRGHKIARHTILSGSPIVKYGRTVGLACQNIQVGDWVHSHNVEDITEKLEQLKQKEYAEKLRAAAGSEIHPYRIAPRLSRNTFMGYKRYNGDVGVRNHIVVISLVQCSNSVAQKIADICGTACISHEGGCMEFPDRLDDLIKGLSIAGMHPNTYGALIVGLGCQQIDPSWIESPIATAGREVHSLCMQTDGGFYRVVAEGVRLVREMQAKAALQKRVPLPISRLVLGSHCGGSDWTSGLSANPICGTVMDIHEAIGGTVVQTAGRGNFITNCGTIDVLQRMITTGDSFRRYNQIRNGKGLSESNPTPGNKLGGLTTLEEKNLGSFESIGHGLFQGWLEVGDKAPGSGFWAIDQCHGNNDSFDTTGIAMSGAHFVVFTTGRGTLIGNACAPTIKITGNAETYQAMPEFFDFLCSSVLEGTQSIESAALDLYEHMLDYADGKFTAAEILGDYSWTIPHAKTLNGEYKEEPARCSGRV